MEHQLRIVGNIESRNKNLETRQPRLLYNGTVGTMSI